MVQATRRSFLAASAFGVGWLGSLGRAAAVAPTERAPDGSKVPATWPTQPPELVLELVGASHGNLARVEELLAQHRTLANAAWDWGFGDWETALGAASHVGNREIALLLLSHGARPSLFSAAMLGQLGVVKASVQASPGAERVAGPHGITLLEHAQAGGDEARPVVDYLTGLGSVSAPEAVAIDDAEVDRLLGIYSFGAGPTERIEIARGRFGLQLKREGTAARRLTHRGARSFAPAGAPEVRVRFIAEQGEIVALEVHDPTLVLRAQRLPPSG